MTEPKLDLAGLKADVLAEMRKPERKEYEGIDLTRKCFQPVGGEDLLALIEAAEENERLREALERIANESQWVDVTHRLREIARAALERKP